METSSVTTTDNNDDNSYETFWMPLLMSCIAGGSTCLGAAVVFCQRRGSIGNSSSKNASLMTKQQLQQRSSSISLAPAPPLVSEGQLSFSLSLAASVMITVSVISIGPECLSINAIAPSTTATWISIWSMTFVHRMAAFLLGCVLYILLSCFAFPDANAILGLDPDSSSSMTVAAATTTTTTTTVSNPSSRSVSPLLWDSSDDMKSSMTSRVSVDSFQDFMEKGSRRCSTSSYTSGSNQDDNNDSTLQQEVILTTTLTKPSTNLSSNNGRSGVAAPRQRRILRKGSASMGSHNGYCDDDLTAATATATMSVDSMSGDDDLDDDGDMESKQFLSEDSEKPEYMALTSTPSWWCWCNGVRRSIVPSCCCFRKNPAVVSSLEVAALQPQQHSWLGADTVDASLPPLTMEQRRAWRVAMLLFVSLLCHNFPEGLAVAASALESSKLGMTVTIGIMIHNIPEGIAIAVPCLAARPHQPCLAFWLASLSGLAEPLGALISLSVLRPLTSATAAAAAAQQAINQDLPTDNNATTINSMFLPNGWLALMFTMENILAFVAGIMITVAVMELFPEAWRHSKQEKMHFITGTIVGIAIMVATEWYLP